MVRDTAAQGGRVLFVGTKRQAADIVEEEAKRCGEFYVRHRWLGGTLTNFQTIKRSIETAAGDGADGGATARRNCSPRRSA